MMAYIADIGGVIGVCAITLTYFLLNAGKMRAEDWLYPLINFIGAMLIVWSLLDEWNLSAFLMESSWAVISFFGLIQAWRRHVKTNGSQKP